METSLLIIILSAVIVFFTFYFASIAGFGSSALTVSLLAFLIDLKTLIPVLIILSFVFNLVLIGKNYKLVDKKAVFPLVIGNVVGNILGVYFLKSIESNLLNKILGVIIILFAIDLAKKKYWKEIPYKQVTGVIAGFVAGVTEMMFSISSPPIVFYLANFIKQKEALRSTLVGFFTISSSFGVFTIALGGLITEPVLQFSAVFTPSAVIGTFLGHKTSLQINEQAYRIIIASILIFSGFLLIFT
jgi:uncharacterized protein